MDNKMEKLEYHDFINNLLAFLEIGFRNPIKIINYDYAFSSEKVMAAELTQA